MLITEDDEVGDFYNRTKGVCGQNIIGDTIDEQSRRAAASFRPVSRMYCLANATAN